MSKRKVSRVVFIGSAILVTVGMGCIKVIGYVSLKVITTFTGGI